MHGMRVVTFSLKMHVPLGLIEIFFQKKHSLLVAVRKVDYKDPYYYFFNLFLIQIKLIYENQMKSMLLHCLGFCNMCYYCYCEVHVDIAMSSNRSLSCTLKSPVNKIFSRAVCI